jgi:hypothetical protein
MVGILWLLFLPLIYIVSGVNVVSRYLLLVTPFVTIYAFSFLQKWIENTRLERHVYTAVLVLTALVLMQNQIVYRAYVKPGMDVFEQGMATCLVPIARWFRENTTPESKIVAADIGALGYYSDRKIFDAAGLISAEFLPLIRQGTSADSIIANHLYERVCSVDYVIGRSTGILQPERSDSLVPIFTKSFFGLSISDPRLTYYTVYKVKKVPPPLIQ